MSYCPVCTGPKSRSLYSRLSTPVHQNLLFPNREAAVQITRGDIRLLGCEECGFIWNAAFDPDRLSYGDRYDHSQGFSPAYQRHFLDRVSRVVKSVRPGSSIMEVGCGQGEFLGQAIGAVGGANGLGVDPSYTGPSETLEGRVRFVRELPKGVIAVDVAIFRHVLAHLPRPLEMFQYIDRSGCQRLFIETPDFTDTICSGNFFDIFYEYCSYFTSISLNLMLSNAGFSPTCTEWLYEGQYLWVEAERTDAPSALVSPDSVETLLAAAAGMQEAERKAKWECAQRISACEGSVAIWGAAAKGATFANLIDPGASRLACLIDINPRKHGSFIGGSGHEVLSPSEAFRRGVRSAIILNPLYLEEIRRMTAELGLPIALISLPSSSRSVQKTQFSSPIPRYAAIRLSEPKLPI